MLAGQVVDPVGDVEPQLDRALASAGRTPTTVAVRQPPVGASATRRRSTASVASVTLVPLLEPRVAAVVVAVLLPEAGLVVVEQRSPATHFALFQK